jgi:hypothetical protein
MRNREIGRGWRPRPVSELSAAQADRRKNSLLPTTYQGCATVTRLPAGAVRLGPRGRGPLVRIGLELLRRLAIMPAKLLRERRR